jgi:hypothetical protein
MTNSQIIEKFIQDAESEMLRVLLDIYNQSLEMSDDEKIQRLTDKLASLFEERNNAPQ